jgi:hypothetical protein
MRRLGMALFYPDGRVLVAGDRGAHLPEDFQKDVVIVASVDDI